MLAGWYEKNGPAAEVLQVTNLPDPEPGPGEVRVRLHVSAERAVPTVPLRVAVADQPVTFSSCRRL